LACWFVATSIATITGPFGTYTSMLPGQRLIYWSVAVYLSIAVAYVMRLLIVEFLPPMSRMRQDLILVPLFGAVFTAVLEVLNHQIFNWSPHDFVTVAGIMTFNMITVGAVALVRRALGFEFLSGMAETAVATAEPAPVVAVRPRLYERIGVAEGRRIMRLTVDDHYVIATFADGGEERVLMRFADAVREMDGQDGFCTHRSHWVSADAVVRTVKVSGRFAIETVDGTVLPVSRTYWSHVEARGLTTGSLTAAAE
jgi:hypothetical protein